MSDTSESCCNSLRILSFQLALASDPLGKGWIARLVFFSGVVSLMLGQFPQRGCAVQSIFFSSYSGLALELWGQVWMESTGFSIEVVSLFPLYFSKAVCLFGHLFGSSAHRKSILRVLTSEYKLQYKGYKVHMGLGAQRKVNPWGSLASHSSQIGELQAQ